MTDEYNADCIKIKNFTADPWAAAISLHEKYPMKPVDWIHRGLEACRLAGIEYGYFIRRYLDGDKSIPLNADVNTIFTEMLKNA